MYDSEWNEKYFNKLFGKYFDNKTIYDLKLGIKKKGLTSLFKYRSGSDKDIENLFKGNLMAVKHKMFNDPFEFQNYVDFDEVRKAYNILFKEDIKESFDYINDNSYLDKYKKIIEFYDKTLETIAKHLFKMNVACLSQDNDSLLMWSHYANEHNGFCIEYDILDLFKRFAWLCPIQYNENMPSVASGGDDSENTIRTIFTKSPEWSYEKEWRIIEFHNEDIVSLKMPQPIAIYMGCRISNELSKRLREYCKLTGAKLYQSKKDRFKYKMNFEQVLV